MKRQFRISANLVVLLVACAGVLGVHFWIRADRTGEVRGSVVYENGAPAAEVEVRLREVVHNLVREGIYEYTDKEGKFKFSDLEKIEFILDASDEEGFRSGPKRVHLYFRGQDVELYDDPLVLQKPPD